MAGKSRNRKALESAVYLSIDCLSLARMPAGWHSRRVARRAVKVSHLARGRALAETTIRAEIDATGGVAVIQHRGTDGMLIEHSVSLQPVSQHFGGHRWFFLCPITGNRARKLYRYPGMSEFRCRSGLVDPVTYRCQRDSAAKRTMRQIWDLRGRLGNDRWLLGAFDKPEGMDDMEFCRHAFRYMELANRLDFSIHGIKVKRTR